MILKDRCTHPYLNRSLQSGKGASALRLNARAIILSLVAPPILLAGCTKHVDADPRLDPPSVPVLKVKTGTVTGQSYTGSVKARVESFLGFRVPGKIIERLVDSGQAVKRGQALYRLDRTDLAHTMNARRDAVLSQRGSVESKLGSVESAKAHMVQADADEKRYRNALAVGVVTDQSYDQYKAAADSARAEFVAAQAEVKAAREQASSLLAQEKVAENESSYSVLVSDADGVVTETLAEPGQVVAVGQTVVKVARQGPREAAVDLPETLRPALGSYAEAKVFNSDFPTCKARLRQLSDSADSATRTFEARYVLQGKSANAPLGSTVTVIPESLKNSKREIVVPLTALIDKGHGPGVWVLDATNSVVHLRPIQINALGNEEAMIGAGLHEGEVFVAQGAHLLHENDKVRTILASKENGPAPLITPPHESQ